MEAAANLYKEMDGKVDAFGDGGTDLGVLIDGKFYPLYSIHPMIHHVKQTPMVDGSGLKNTLEGQALPALIAHMGDRLKKKHLPDNLPGKAVITNTTTPEDVELFRQVGIPSLVTSTTSLDRRSFGTNIMMKPQWWPCRVPIAG